MARFLGHPAQPDGKLRHHANLGGQHPADIFGLQLPVQAHDIEGFIDDGNRVAGISLLEIRSQFLLPLLQPLAPTGTEPPFAIAQGLVLLAFAGFTVLALKRFYPPRDNAAVGVRLP